MDDMYREVIIEHYKNPAYRGVLDPCDHSYEDENPGCGDELRVMINVDDAIGEDIGSSDEVWENFTK